MAHPPPSPPYLGPPDKFSAGSNKPIRRIVIHSTVSPCERGGARKIAAYFRSDAAGGSAHYVIDPYEAVQSAYDSLIAWHAPPNPGSLGLEMCDIPGPVPAVRQAVRSWRWTRREQRLMLRRTATLAAELCLAYSVPAVFLRPGGLRAGRAGITTHAHVSAAFHQSSHWDPGWWPKRWFMRMVRAEIKRLESKR